MAEEAGSELFECACETEVLFDEVDAGLATQLTRQAQVFDVDHVHVFDAVACRVDVEQAAVVVTTYFGELRVQHRQGEHFAFFVADDASERVAVQQQRNKNLLEVVVFGDTDVGCVKPHRSRAILQPHAILTDERVDGQAGNRVGNQTHTCVDGANLQRVILGDIRSRVRRERVAVTKREQRLERDCSLFFGWLREAFNNHFLATFARA